MQVKQPELNRDFLIQDAIVPVCSAIVRNGKSQFCRLLGSAFFINMSGVFLTCRHVMENSAKVLQSEEKLGLLTRAISSDARSLFTEIKRFEYAPAPFDICIGETFAQSLSNNKLVTRELSMWSEVAAVGYPETAFDMNEGKPRVESRGFKGYILRKIRAGAMPLRPAPDCWELNFSVPRGLSGGPLFEVFDSGPAPVVGICAGVVASEVVDYQGIEILEGGNTRKETRLRVEQYGIAEATNGLLEWRPQLFSGKTLEELNEYFVPTYANN